MLDNQAAICLCKVERVIELLEGYKLDGVVKALSERFKKMIVVS